MITAIYAPDDGSKPIIVHYTRDEVEPLDACINHIQGLAEPYRSHMMHWLAWVIFALWASDDAITDQRWPKL